MKKLIFICFILILMSAHVMATTHSVKDRLLGTWKLIAITNQSVSSGTKTDSYGPNPKGYLTYSSDGHVMVLIVKGDRKKPNSGVLTSNEAAALMSSMTSYAGTFTIKDDQIIHHVDISWNESWSGTKQVRFYQLEGNRLRLTMAPVTDPVEGKVIVSLVWEKIQ